MSNRVLVIEDDRQLVDLVRASLTEVGFIVEAAFDGISGVELACTREFDLVLLDLGLPRLDGVEVCKRIREKRKDVGIIMLTSRADETSKVVLLELGADDYVVKPFGMQELGARIKAVMRRSNRRAASEGVPQVVSYRDLTIDLEKRRVLLRGEPVTLTAREFDLLAVLASRRGRPFTRDELNAEVYGHDVSGYDRSVSSHICRVRAKIEDDPEDPQYVLTVRGVGYSFPDEES